MTMRILPALGAAAFITAYLLTPGCGSNEPSLIVGTGGAPGTGGTVSTTGTGGTVSTTGTGGTVSTTGTGGTVSTTGTGGTIGAGVGGTVVSSGTGGTSGGAGGATTGSMGGNMFSPSCAAVPLTAAGVAPTKGGTCTTTDTQLCYKTCGPQSIGFKSETCSGGTYAEQSGCSFPAGVDYSCYKIPTTIDATCPATAPQASQPCTVAPCTLCNVGGNYLDTSGASKPGYCVCPMAGASGTAKWSCASGTSWPCPAGQGC